MTLPHRIFLLALFLVSTASADVPSLDRASERLTAGALDDAEQAFRAVSEATPDSAEPWLGLAQVETQRGRPLAALDHLRKARELEPNNADAAFAAGELLVDIGAPAEALEALATVRRLEPQRAEAYLLAALVLRDVERLDQAMELLTTARERGMTDSRIAEELALLHLAEGEAKEALALGEEIIAKDAQDAGGHLVVGLARAAIPELRGDAREPLEEALRQGVARPGRLHLELATLDLEADAPEDALRHLRSAREDLPEDPETLYRLGTALATAGDAEAAREVLGRFQELGQERDAEERRSKEIGTALNAAQEAATAGRLQDALKSLDDLSKRYPKEGRVEALRAKILFSMGQRDEAVEALRRARKLSPHRSEYPYLEGVFLYGLKRPFEAAAALQAALALDAGLGEARALLGMMALGWDDPALAASHFQKALDAGVDTPDLRLAYAQALRDLGRERESAQQLEAWRRLGGS